MQKSPREGIVNMNNRWIILAAGCLIQTVLGGIYAWSTFVPYLTKDYGLNSGQCGFIFGTAILMFTSAMIFAGKLLIKKGPRFTAVISAILFMIGYLIASFSNGSFTLLLISLGGVAGCGIGFGYVCPLSVGMKWFPKKKGLVTGVAVAGFGAGAIILSSIAKTFLLEGVDILLFFRWFGIFAGIILFAAALLLSEPSDSEDSSVTSFTKSALFSWPFYINVVGIFAGTFAGLMMIGNLTPIVLNIGFSVQQASLAVSVFAIGNGIGRIAWGRLFDTLHYKSIPLSLLGLAIASGALLIPSPNWMLLLIICFIGFCFGANFVVYASAISRFFGTTSFPRLYPICFMAYGIAGIIGPGMGGFIADYTGSYQLSIYICIGIISAAAILTYLKLSAFEQNLKDN